MSIHGIENEIKKVHISKINDRIMQYPVYLEAVFIQQTYNRDLTLAGSPLLLLMHYLFSIEGAYNTGIDIVIFSLIKNHHHDLWTGYKYVDKFDDLLKISLFNKLRFLDHHGFKNITKLCNRELRNSIAHSTFLIFDDYIKYGGSFLHNEEHFKKITFNEIRNEINSIRDFYEILINCARAHLMQEE